MHTLVARWGIHRCWENLTANGFRASSIQIHILRYQNLSCASSWRIVIVTTPDKVRRVTGNRNKCSDVKIYFDLERVVVCKASFDSTARGIHGEPVNVIDRLAIIFLSMQYCKNCTHFRLPLNRICIMRPLASTANPPQHAPGSQRPQQFRAESRGRRWWLARCRARRRRSGAGCPAVSFLTASWATASQPARS